MTDVPDSGQSTTSIEQPGKILCFGCKQRFGSFEAYQRHQSRREHIDKGETWVSA